MKNKMNNELSAINKDAIVGNRSKIIVINPPVPKLNTNKIRVTAKSSKPKRKKCSGCSRKKRIG